MKYKSHSCITAIQNQFKNADTFYITELDIEKEIEKLNTKKLAKKFLYIYIYIYKGRKALKEITDQLVAILLVLSKLYQKILFKQMASFFEKMFSKN